FPRRQPRRGGSGTPRRPPERASGTFRAPSPQRSDISTGRPAPGAGGRHGRRQRSPCPARIGRPPPTEADHSNTPARHSKPDMAPGLQDAWRRGDVDGAQARISGRSGPCAPAWRSQRRSRAPAAAGPALAGPGRRRGRSWRDWDGTSPIACGHAHAHSEDPQRTMTMPAFLRASACALLLSAASPLALAASVTGTVQVDRPGAVIAPELYGQFMEQLGTGIDGGIWVGPDSDIPNTRGYRNDVLEALKELKVPVLRWPGGCYADIYDWRTGIGPRESRPVTLNRWWGNKEE